MAFIMKLVCLSLALLMMSMGTEGNNAIIQSGICTRRLADIVFVMDASGSVGSSNWAKVTQFTKQIVECFEIGQNKVRVGAVRFASSASVRFYLNDNQFDKTKVQAALLNIPYTGGFTNIADGLRKARVNVYTAARGDRTNAPNVVIFIADGKDNRETSQTLPQATLLKNAGAFIISVGVTNGIDIALMKKISSNNQVTHVNTFNNLASIVTDIVKLACQNAGCEPMCNKPCGIGYFVVNCNQVTSKPCCNKPCGIHQGNPANNGPLCRDYEPYKSIV